MEWENDPKIIYNEEKIMKRKFRNSNTKEKIFFGVMKQFLTGLI
jgi:hypothetical protein